MFGRLNGAPLATTAASNDPGCLTVTHNWNTNAVIYSAWYSDNSTGSTVWVPVPVQANQGGENVALNKTVTASPAGTTGAPSLLVDGSTTTSTGFVTPTSTIPSGSLTIDLGASFAISQISVVTNLTTGGGTGTERWIVSLSDFPSSWSGATVIATDTCNAGQSCSNTYPISGSPSGRYLRWTCDQSWGNAQNNFCLVNELQVYPVAGYSVFQPDANSVRVCNYSGTTRDLALRVVR